MYRRSLLNGINDSFLFCKIYMDNIYIYINIFKNIISNIASITLVDNNL